MNLGQPYEQKVLQEILDAKSKAAAVILTAIMGSGDVWSILDRLAQQIHKLGQCDGPIAADGKLLLNRSDPNYVSAPTLDALTRDTGRYSPPPTFYKGSDSGPGCGSNSNYGVTWSVVRTSWQPS